MTMLTHTHGIHALHEDAISSRVLDVASHRAALKRFAKFAAGFTAVALVVAAIVGVKLAIFVPHFVH